MGPLTQFETKSTNSQQIYVLLHKQTSKYHSVVNIIMIMNLIAIHRHFPQEKYQSLHQNRLKASLDRGI